MGIRILQKKETYTIDYPTAIEFAERQAGIVWFPFEIAVEKDLHNLKVDCSESEYHGVISTLKLFTLYELSVGNEYWKGYVGEVFPRPDIQRMADCFSFFETNVHAPFYNEINRILGLDTDEFYTSYLDDPVLKNRMAWVGKRVSKRSTLIDILKSVGIFSMIEGAILYSSFAFLKHFNSNGKNKLVNINAGINFSAIDEAIHSQAGAWLFLTLLKEALADGQLTDEDLKHLEEEFNETAKIILEHENVIIKKIFERGAIKGITDTQLSHFVESRLDLCLKQLGYKPIFKPHYNPIGEWFYKDIESTTLHDFFASQGNDYHRKWQASKFIW